MTGNILGKIQNNEKEKAIQTTNTSKENQAHEANANCKHCNGRGTLEYLTCSTNSKKSRCLRIIILIFASMVTIYVCTLSSKRYWNSWVQTVIDSTDVHVSEIAFPAVTICPIKLLNKRRLIEAKIKFLGQNYTPDNEEHFEAILKFIEQIVEPREEETATATDTFISSSESKSKSSPTSSTLSSSLSEFTSILSSYEIEMETSNNASSRSEKTSEMRIDTDVNAAVALDDTTNIMLLFKRLFRNVRKHNFPFKLINLPELITFMAYDCDEIFAETCIWRRKKVNCCDLFRVSKVHSSMCYAFNSLIVENPPPLWPVRLANAGDQSGLHVPVKTEFTAMIHEPREVLGPERIYIHGQHAVITVSPLRFSSDPDLLYIEPEQRHCYFTSEMKMWGNSRSSCITNCRIFFIEKTCKCTYYFPFETRNDKLPECNFAHSRCIFKHMGALVNTGNIIIDENDKNNTSLLDCQCYPNCNYIQYRTAIYQDNAVLKDAKSPIDLHIYYEHETFFSYRSVLRFTLLDLVVSYGGIMGLILGFSLLGIVETFYQFLHYRFSRLNCRKKNTNKSENENKLKEAT